MAIRAATRNVLSPISVKMIMVKETTKEWNHSCQVSWSSVEPPMGRGLLALADVAFLGLVLPSV